MKGIVMGTNTLVVLGAWNIAIFTPEWVKNNILLENQEARVLVPMNIGCSLRFETEYYSFFIEGERLSFTINKEEESSYIFAIQTLRNIIQKLPHTPVRALGTNFVFKKDTKFDVLENLDDSDKLKSVVDIVGNSVTSQALVRKFKLTDIEDLNLKIEEDPQKGSLLDFNFNYNLKSTEDILNLIGEDNNLLLNNKALANDISNNVYGE